MKKIAYSEILEEKITKIISYTLSREKDKHSKSFENALKNLKREYGCDYVREVFDIDEL